MKKKSFLSGFSAKIALVAVALSSALLTGCYKDEGLDTDTPAGTVTLPEATYTLTGTIVDKDGVMIAGATGTAAGQNFTGATFSVKTQPGEQTITAKAEGYNEVTKKVQILEVKPGQSAVYSEIIVLTKEEVEPVYKTYDLNVAVFGADDTNTPLAAENYSLKVTDESGTEVSALTGLVAGHYNVVVTPTDAAKYVATTCSVDLPKVEGEANAAYYLPVVLNLKDAEKEYQILYAEVNAMDSYKLNNISILKNGVEVVAVRTNKVFYLAEKDGSVYSLKVAYLDNNNKQGVVERTFTDKVTSFYIELGERNSVDVEGGNVKAGTYRLGDDEFSVAEGTIASLNGETYDGSFELVRMKNLEVREILRAYNGTPDGLSFSKPIQIAFDDIWGGELGKLNLVYQEDNGLLENEGSVNSVDNKYVMDVEHFSNFYAQLPFEVVSGGITGEVKDVTEHIIDRKNDTDVPVTIPYTYTYKSGMSFNVEAAVRAAGFTNEEAISYVTNLITLKMSDLNLVNTGIVENKWTQDIVVMPWTVLNKVTKTQLTLEYTGVFEVAGKTVIVDVDNPYWARIEPDTFTYGHGHGHGHGHGGDLNAGGGIIEGE